MLFPVFLCKPQYTENKAIRVLLAVIIESPEMGSYPSDTLTYGRGREKSREKEGMGGKSREKRVRVSFGMRLTPEKKDKKGEGEKEKEIHRESTFRENGFGG